jgi:O-antigen/teichoic acid export membrane protein
LKINLIKNNKVKSASYNYIFNFSSFFFAILTSLLLIPFYLEYISLSDYGAWLASSAAIGMIGLLDPGIGTILTQRLSVFYELKDDDKFSDLFNVAIFIGLGMFVVSAIIGLLFIELAMGVMKYSGDMSNGIYIGLIYVVLAVSITPLTTIVGSVLQARHDTLYAGISLLVSTLLAIIVLIVGFITGYGIVTLGFAIFIITICNLLLQSYRLVTSGGVKNIFQVWPRKELAIDIMKRSSYLYVPKGSSIIANNVEVALIGALISSEMSAVYIVSKKIFQLTSMLIDRIGTAVFAGVSGVFSSNNNAQINSALIKILSMSILIGSTGVAFSLGVGEQFIKIWIGESAYAGNLLFALIGLAVLFESRSVLLRTLLIANNLVGQVAIIQSLEIFMKIGIMWILISSLGATAIPIATIITSLIVILYFDNVILQKFEMTNIHTLYPGFIPMIINLLIGIVWMLLYKYSESIAFSILEMLIFATITLTVSLLTKSSRNLFKEIFTRFKSGLNK